MNDSQWKVYCIEYNHGEKTYCGATVNFPRRIRQHNCELVGGAKYTSAAIQAGSDCNEWKPVFLIHGFPNRVAALQFEWALKKQSIREKGKTRIDRRLNALDSLFQKEKVTANADLLKNWNLHIEYF
jgi:structure-specific endonuclease subunit SLX1